MLVALCQRLRQAAPEIRICMPLHHSFHYRDRAVYRVELAVRPPELGRPPRRFGQDLLCYTLSKTPLSSMLGFVHERDISGLIDISGYAFGDKWLVETTERFARRAEAYKHRGKPVVMLPQMLGPFKTPGQAEAFQRLCSHVDIIYARESESFDHARPLAGEGTLRVAPDITIPLQPISTPKFTGRYACIVPNSRLCEPNPHQFWGERYLPRLVAACRYLASLGIQVKIVQHEYHAGDTNLVEALRGEIGDDGCEVFRHPDPRVLKGVLGGAELVIGSRFHSLVSALSMGVPSIALGWAHKYEALLNDFGMPSLNHFADHSKEDLYNLIDRTLHQRNTLTAVLMERKSQLALTVEAMWTDVLDLLEITSSSARCF